MTVTIPRTKMLSIALYPPLHKKNHRRYYLNPSKKQAIFLKTPYCWTTNVDTLPGVGKKAAENMTKNGVGTASEIVDKYLQLKRENSKLEFWLKEEMKMSSKCSKECTIAIKEWTMKYIGK